MEFIGAPTVSERVLAGEEPPAQRVASVEAKEGKPLFIDGPYAETKEHLGGFTVVSVPDDDAARGA